MRTQDPINTALLRRLMNSYELTKVRKNSDDDPKYSFGHFEVISMRVAQT